MDVGGHNPIEPALCGIPIVCGPFQHNFSDVMAHMGRQGGLLTITGSEDMAQTIGVCLERSEAREVAARAAYTVVENNRGAQEKVRALIYSLVARAVAQED